MECRPLDITLNSAKDLKDLNLFSKMDLYAVVSIHGDYFNNNTSQQRTHIDKDCGPNPKWNFPMKFTIDINAAEQNRLALVVKIKAEKKLAGDKEVGEVHVPIKELLESYGEESKDERRASYSVRTPSGKAKGVLDFTYKFGEKFTATQQKAKNADTDTPVTAYPVGYGAAGPSGGPAPAYPPPGMLAAGTVAAAYPYAHQPPPHGGYPPQGGYPPPPMYGGYPPQPAYNGGYPQYPHQPAPYPQAGYGGYGAKPPKKSGGSGGKMALGLGAGLLGGLLVGDMISDVSEMGAYDSGYDAGFDDAGGPKRHFLPLLLLFSISAFFLLFLHSYFSTSNPNSNPSFINSLKNPNPKSPNFTFIIKVLAFNRLDSLSRCLRSLAAADYLSDPVHLHIHIDHFASTNNDSLQLDRNLGSSHRILEFVDDFDWRFGEKLVHYRTGNAGLQAQWLEAWWPSSDNEFAFVVEDDLEVSPLYYRFLRSLIVNFYYNASNYSPYIFGASLQRPRFVPGKHGNKIQLDNNARLFLYQLVGTWGQLLFPKPWKEFRLWYDIHKAKGIKPFLEGMVTTGWYKKMGERIWTPWFIKFIHSHGYFNIYTNFLRERALSVSHRDAGVNYGKTAGPDSHLLDESSLDFNFLEMQPLSNLKWYDFCFKEVLPGRVVTSDAELGSVLYGVQNQKSIILVSLFGVSEPVTRNLLCHFERLNIWNYIFMGPESDFLLDLSRRGHPVINADKFLYSVRAYKSMTFQGSNAELIKEILMKAYVIKKCLEYRYNSWMVDGKMLFTSSDLFLETIDPTVDFYVGKRLELMHVRSSSSAEKFWTGAIMSKVAEMVDSLTRKASISRDGMNFVYVAANLLEQKGVRIKRVDETSLGLNIDTNNVSQSSLGGGKKMVFWSSEIVLDLIQKRLQELGMWFVDSDFSCIAVVCHRL